MNKLRRCICLLLLASAVLGFCACGDGENAEAAAEAESAPKNNFSFVESSLPSPMALATCQYTDGESIFFCGMDIAGEPLLIKTWTDEETGQERSLEYKLPEEADFVFCCCKEENWLTVLAGDRPLNSYSGNLSMVSNKQESYALYVMRFTEKGNLIGASLLESPLDQGISPRSVVCMDGNYYILSRTQFARADRDGHVLGRIITESGTFVSQAVVDKELIVCRYSGDGENPAELARLISSKGLELESLCSIDSWQVQGLGCTAEGELLINDAGTIYKPDTDSGTQETVFDFYAENVSISEYANIYPYKDGYMLSNLYLQKNVTLSPRDAETRTELTLWTEYMIPDVLDCVRGFNQQSKGYYISVEDVSELSAEQLMGKIANGEAPDLYNITFDTSNSVLSGFKSGQICEDLNEYMPEGTILLALQRCLEQNGKLYIMPTEFSFETVVTYKHSPVDTSLTLAQQEAALAEAGGEYSLFPNFRDASAIWDKLSALYLNRHVDTETASCNFETPLFIQILEYCANPDANNGGDTLEYQPSVYFIDSFPGPLRLTFFQQKYKEELQLVSDIGSSFYVGQCYGISNTSQNKDGAVEFLNYLNSREPDNPRFTWPASTKMFEKLLLEYQTTGIWYENEDRFVALTDDTVAQLYALLEATNGLNDSHPALTEIMNEEAEKCFSGDCSAEDAAKSIQSRASIYLAEQYG